MEIPDLVEGRGVPVSPDAQVASPATDLAAQLALVDDTCSLVQLVLLRAVHDTRSDRGVLSWIDGSEMIVAGSYDPFGHTAPVGSRWPLAGEKVSALALAAGTAEAGTYADVVFGAVHSPELLETYAGLKHLLVVPVRVAGQDVAMLCVSRRRSEEFSRGDSAILESVALASAHALRSVRLADLLGSANRRLDELADRAESVERVKTDVLRLASHELRSPLTVLHGYLSLVQSGFYGEIDEPLAAVIGILHRRTEQMNALVNDMLVAARVEDAPPEVSGRLLDLRELLRDAVRGVVPSGGSRHRLLIDEPEEPVPVRADSDLTVLALRNIVDNAVKYSPDGGDIVCAVRREADVVSVQVRDHGLGIAREDRDKLFTRFGRILTTANSHIPGIGLGLYFSREVARRHGGDVALLDLDQPGAVFELSLPLAT